MTLEEQLLVIKRALLQDPLHFTDAALAALAEVQSMVAELEREFKEVSAQSERFRQSLVKVQGDVRVGMACLRDAAQLEDVAYPNLTVAADDMREFRQRAEESEKQLATEKSEVARLSCLLSQSSPPVAAERSRGDRMKAALREVGRACINGRGGDPADVVQECYHQFYKAFVVDLTLPAETQAELTRAALAPTAQAIFDNVVADPLSDLEKSLTETAYRFAAPTAGGMAAANQSEHEQITYMANRFLQWKLPKDFQPDCGIYFDANAAKKLNPNNHTYEPVGTNLLSADQAKDMVRFMIDGSPSTGMARPQ